MMIPRISLIATLLLIFMIAACAGPDHSHRAERPPSPPPQQQLSRPPQLVPHPAVTTAPARPQAAPGEIWQNLAVIAERSDYKIEVTANKKRFRIGEKLTVAVYVDKPGYVNVLNVGPSDKEATVLYPNKWHQNNFVRGGSIVYIPAPGDHFYLGTDPPAGESLVVVFHTEKDINAYREGTDSIGAALKTMSRSTAKEFEVESVEPQTVMGAGSLVFTIEE